MQGYHISESHLGFDVVVRKDSFGATSPKPPSTSSETRQHRNR